MAGKPRASQAAGAGSRNVNHRIRDGERRRFQPGVAGGTRPWRAAEDPLDGPAACAQPPPSSAGRFSMVLKVGRLKVGG